MSSLSDFQVRSESKLNIMSDSLMFHLSVELENTTKLDKKHFIEEFLSLNSTHLTV